MGGGDHPGPLILSYILFGGTPGQMDRWTVVPNCSKAMTVGDTVGLPALGKLGFLALLGMHGTLGIILK